MLPAIGSSSPPQPREEGAAEATSAKELVTLRAALKLARRKGLWLGDVAGVVPIAFSAEYKPETRFLTRDELGKLLAELQPDRAARVAFIVATSASCKESEARREDVAENLALSCCAVRSGRRATAPFRSSARSRRRSCSSR